MKEKILNIPNILTISRFALSPIFFVFLLTNRKYIGLVIFIIVALTDAVDGFIARSKKQKSTFGEIVDPMADKFMILLAVIALIIRFEFPIFGILILSRDLVSLSGSAVSYFKKKEIWKANRFGKLTTAFQVVTIFSFIINLNFRFIILLFTIGLSFLAAITYLARIIGLLRKR